MKHTVLAAAAVALSLFAMPVLAGTPDGLITSKTKLSLWTTAGVRSTAVHVDTNDGVVTLYGKVPTAEQKALAEKTTREVMGVRSVKSLLQVVSDSQEKRVEASDKDLMTSAAKRLKAEPTLRDSSISVKSVDKGVVLLSGEAHTFSDHLKALSIVDRIPGVQRVATEVKSPDGFGNDERVTFLSDATPRPLNDGKGPAVASSASDMRITAAVKLRLLTTSAVPSNEISVDTEDAVVTLFGIVPSAEVKKVAMAEAVKVKGVVRVLNQLEVVGTPQKAMVDAKDEDIARDLGLALKDRPEFKGIDTAVKNATVRLTGTVASGWDEVNAVRLVRAVTGVRTVEDQLKVDEKLPEPTTRRE